MRFELQIDVERCKGCALCVAACPRTLLIMTDKLNSKGHHYVEIQKANDCIGCRQCAVICPDAAIEILQEDD